MKKLLLQTYLLIWIACCESIAYNESEHNVTNENGAPNNETVCLTSKNSICLKQIEFYSIIGCAGLVIAVETIVIICNRCNKDTWPDPPLLIMNHGKLQATDSEKSTRIDSCDTVCENAGSQSQNPLKAKRGNNFKHSMQRLSMLQCIQPSHTHHHRHRHHHRRHHQRHKHGNERQLVQSPSNSSTTPMLSQAIDNDSIPKTKIPTPIMRYSIISHISNNGESSIDTYFNCQTSPKPVVKSIAHLNTSFEVNNVRQNPQEKWKQVQHSISTTNIPYQMSLAPSMSSQSPLPQPPNLIKIKSMPSLLDKPRKMSLPVLRSETSSCRDQPKLIKHGAYKYLNDKVDPMYVNMATETNKTAYKNNAIFSNYADDDAMVMYTNTAHHYNETPKKPIPKTRQVYPRKLSVTLDKTIDI